MVATMTSGDELVHVKVFDDDGTEIPTMCADDLHDAVRGLAMFGGSLADFSAEHLIKVACALTLDADTESGTDVFVSYDSLYRDVELEEDDVLATLCVLEDVGFIYSYDEFTRVDGEILPVYCFAESELAVWMMDKWPEYLEWLDDRARASASDDE